MVESVVDNVPCTVYGVNSIGSADGPEKLKSCTRDFVPAACRAWTQMCQKLMDVQMTEASCLFLQECHERAGINAMSGRDLF